MKKAYTGSLSKNRKQDKEISNLKKKVNTISKAQELKYTDIAIVDEVIFSNVTAGPYQFDLAALGAWDSSSANANETRQYSREGNKVVVKRAHLKGTIFLANDQGSTLDKTYETKVRMLIVLSPDSGYPLIAQVLEKPNSIFSPRKVKPENPYKVLYDRTFDLQSITQVRGHATTGVNVTSTEKFRHNFDIKLGAKAFGKEGLKCTWQQGSTSIHPQQGAVTVFVYSTAGDGSWKPQIAAETRLRFLDN